MRRASVVVVLVLVLVACRPAAPVHAGPAGAAERHVDRLLVVSLPEVSWQDVEAGRLPRLEAFAARAAIASMATRVGRRPATVGDAYVTMGSGTRAYAPEAGVGLESGEPYGDAPAGTVFARRTGQHPTAGALLHLAIGSIDRRNQSSDYGAQPGELGDRLERGGVRRAVLANADLTREPDTLERFGRYAVAMLMGSDGVVPEGAVAPDRVLRSAPGAPFGIALDVPAVVRSFRDLWRAPGPLVALVEASDLHRVERYRTRASPAEAARQREQALADADALLGALLEEVDPERDAVFVVSPVAREADAELSLAALAVPGGAPGLLESPSTRRPGFVVLADVAPTVLDLFGLDVPTAMEGRPARAVASSATVEDRVARLAASAREAELRNLVVPWATTTLSVLFALLAIAWVLRARLPSALVSALPVIGLVMLAVVPATYLAGIADTENVAALVAVVSVLTAIFAAALVVLRRWREIDAVVVALALGGGVLVVDILFGARLQLNTLFGYSTSVAGRFAGVGNLAFGFLSATLMLLAVVVRERFPGRRGLHVAIAILVVGVLVDGLPVLGSDSGGVLTMVPAFGVTAMLLAGRTPRPWHVVAWLAAGATTVFAFGIVDLLRPARERTHLGRFLERVGDEGSTYVTRVFARRFDAAIGGPRTATWVLLLVGAMVVAAALVARTRQVRVRGAGRAALAGLAVLTVVGLLVNDSGLGVPAVMLTVAVPVFVLRASAWIGRAEAAT